MKLWRWITYKLSRKSIANPDAIIPRIGASRTFYGLCYGTTFEMLDVFSTTGNLALTRSRDKLRSLQVLSRNDVDMPRTVFASNKSNAKDVITFKWWSSFSFKIFRRNSRCWSCFSW